eukprot:6176778-Pleurochrysis_carterae.AAC.2
MGHSSFIFDSMFLPLVECRCAGNMRGSVEDEFVLNSCIGLTWSRACAHCKQASPHNRLCQCGLHRHTGPAQAWTQTRLSQPLGLREALRLLYLFHLHMRQKCHALRGRLGGPVQRGPCARPKHCVTHYVPQ